MFSEHEPLRKEILRVILVDSKGCSQTVHPGRTVPIEYFRAQGLYRNVFQRGGDEGRKRAFSKIVLEGLNDSPWGFFDEMMWPAKPSEGAVFVGLEVILQHMDFTGQTPVQSAVLTSQRTIYRYEVGIL